jgi:hypothetical protein
VRFIDDSVICVWLTCVINCWCQHYINFSSTSEEVSNPTAPISAVRYIPDCKQFIFYWETIQALSGGVPDLSLMSADNRVLQAMRCQKLWSQSQQVQRRKWGFGIIASFGNGQEESQEAHWWCWSLQCAWHGGQEVGFNAKKTRQNWWYGKMGKLHRQAFSFSIF